MPEATALDAWTRQRLAEAKEPDLYVSDVSPLGIPFNNLHGSSSETWTRRRAAEGRPGSRCPHGYLASNTEHSERPRHLRSRREPGARGKAARLATELVMYVDHLERQIDALPPGDAPGLARLEAFRENLEQGLAHYRALAGERAFEGENLASLGDTVEREGRRLAEMWARARRDAGPVPAASAAREG